ncbi:Uncharacterised protein [Serratia liquefaciens]|uniref:hypothetical protein n=1 Tax=Serratia liquefaciens TaxID=614 RepID=UPI0021836108|nr:hypothetical protein [Serratia liquefaciens]CAI2426304.1 Uncharacterised protein [Serratia liquefaciens]
MIKRFNPDFSLSISHELAYMRETPEGGYVAHGDYATLFSELESVKAERDALAANCGLYRESISKARRLINIDEMGDADDVLAKAERDLPATSAALAAIEARGVEKLIKLKMEQLANMHPDTHAFGATAEAMRTQITWLQAFAIELREAK